MAEPGDPYRLIFLSLVIVAVAAITAFALFLFGLPIYILLATLIQSAAK